jgi:hypothetical protein
MLGISKFDQKKEKKTPDSNVGEQNKQTNKTMSYQLKIGQIFSLFFFPHFSSSSSSILSGSPCG